MGSNNFPASAATTLQDSTSSRRSKPEANDARTRVALAALVVALAYFAGAKLGFAFTFKPHPISLVWLPNALLLAGLLLTPARAWWIVLVAVLPAHLAAELQSGVPASMVFAWYVSNCSEALIGASAIRLLAQAPPRFGSLRDTSIFLVCGVGIAPLLSTFIDIALVKAIGWGEGDFAQLFQLRFMSNALAAALFVPVIVTWAEGGLHALRKATARRTAECALLFTGLLFAGLFVFESTDLNFAAGPALLYAPIPFLLWAAVRLGQRSLSLALVLTFGLATWGAIHGHGPFLDGAAERNALAVQLFMLAVSIPFLLFSAVMEEHRLDKRALQVSEERALKVFRGSPDAMAIVRVSDGVLMDVNDRWTELFRHPRETVVGRTSANLDLYAEPGVRDTYLRLAREQSVRNFPADMRNNDGGIINAVLSGEMVDIGGTECLVSVVRDITAQKQAERETQEQRLELAHLSRVAVLGELSGALAHELNQPLTAILSNAQTAQRLLARQGFDGKMFREILDDIVSEDKRAGEVIRRLRVMFKKGEPQLQPMELNELVADALALAGGNLATRQVQALTRLCPHPLFTRGDRIQLQQVLLNLVINACEAMEARDSRRELRIETAPLADGRVQVLVRDGGPGVPADVMARLFDPFFTTKSQGLGLGLSISRSIVTAHGGELLARNNPDRGATFRMILPGQP